MESREVSTCAARFRAACAASLGQRARQQSASARDRPARDRPIAPGKRKERTVLSVLADAAMASGDVSALLAILVQAGRHGGGAELWTMEVGSQSCGMDDEDGRRCYPVPARGRWSLVLGDWRFS